MVQINFANFITVGLMSVVAVAVLKMAMKQAGFPQVSWL